VTVPVDYTFVVADSGVHTFAAGLTVRTAGEQTVTATDTGTGTITGSQTGITVQAAGAASFSLTIADAVTSGSPTDIAVTALDPFNNVATSYTGTIHFTTSDSGVGVVLPGDYTFNGAENGVRAFPGGVRLVTAGSQTITVSDGTLTGQQSLTVN
jgi:hypothetical protein